MSACFLQAISGERKGLNAIMLRVFGVVGCRTAANILSHAFIMTFSFSQSQIDHSKRLAAENAALDDHEIEIAGLRFTIGKGVFSPAIFHSTDIFARAFPYLPGDHLLEVGCGAGVMPVLAIRAGAERVLAVDINNAALKCALSNAKSHGVESAVEIRHSDIYSSLKPWEKFSTIYWNTPFIPAPAEYSFASDIERALFDPDYQLIRRFLLEAHKHLMPGGRVLVGIADGGGLASFFEAVELAGYTVREVCAEMAGEGEQLKMMLFELTQREPTTQKAGRNERIMSAVSHFAYTSSDEIKRGCAILNSIEQPLVAIFGSHRVQPDAPEFAACTRLVGELAARGFGVLTGGGPGIMLAANRAASAAGVTSVGFKARLLTREAVAEPIYTHRADFNWMYIRTFLMLLKSKALIFFPGGYGTLDELFEYAMLMQTGLCDRVPIFCIGSEYWAGLTSWLHERVAHYYLINGKPDLSLFNITDNVDAVIAVISQQSDNVRLD